MLNELKVRTIAASEAHGFNVDEKAMNQLDDIFEGAQKFVNDPDFVSLLQTTRPEDMLKNADGIRDKYKGSNQTMRQLNLISASLLVGAAILTLTADCTLTACTNTIYYLCSAQVSLIAAMLNNGQGST